MMSRKERVENTHLEILINLQTHKNKDKKKVGYFI